MPLFFAAFAAIQYHHTLPPSGSRILATLPLVVKMTYNDLQWPTMIYNDLQFFAAFAAIQYHHTLPPSGSRILATLPLVVKMTYNDLQWPTMIYNDLQ